MLGSTGASEAAAAGRATNQNSPETSVLMKEMKGIQKSHVLTSRKEYWSASQLRISSIKKKDIWGQS